MTVRTTSILTAAGIFLSVAAISCDNNVKSTNSAAEAQSADVGEEQSATRPQTATAQQPAPSSQPTPVIPDFTFYILRSGIQFTKADLAKKGNLVFILFDPTCGHCQHEASHLGEHYSEVQDANFYFVSMNDPALMSTFLETHAKPLVGKDNVELLYDKNADFINKFHIPSQYPAVYIYGNNGQLKEYWDGERNIKDVVAAIRN
ncbi:TlpA family protein disulfide reductase [Parapedobacter indicus]|uniref:AhpC/TSA family protein n=1 Tax=Parapedobacter indicus TaxID=1477437 RepID=A0A1I3RAX2_9SPHI|nr:redoxin domain-containing protein [Parapedobacter indicus]PPL00392.1 AhpC/TSA family protein [Parapedobacter indicus]SFJ42336.1 AhpC/TSA family protein [Parapedobacter indicus]